MVLRGRGTGGWGTEKATSARLSGTHLFVGKLIFKHIQEDLVPSTLQHDRIEAI